MLAACCREKSPITKDDKTNIFYFDRDWWLFRHILTYLRSNVLPRELETLRELYTESSFYRLESLKKSIEEMPMHEVIDANSELSNSTNTTNNINMTTKSIIN